MGKYATQYFCTGEEKCRRTASISGKPSASTEPTELSGVLKNFIDPATGLRFSDYAFNVDIVFSSRAFSLLQPEPDLVLPAQSLWECRAEALAEMKIRDAPSAFLKPLS
jgi:hypothetical protein